MKTVSEMIRNSDTWLSECVFPLWSANAIDPLNGGFVESLDAAALPVPGARRALVQARQIYAYTEALKMKILNRETVEPIIRKNIEFMTCYSAESGAYIHAVDVHTKPVQLQSELYTQAFMLFGLARAYDCLKDPAIKGRALKLVNYLLRERKNVAGGFTEIKDGQIVFQSNPHMHLFEALIEWLRIDHEVVWKELAQQIYHLCKDKFVNNSIGVVAEYFSKDWQSLREQETFIFEPGHQYEWAWLLIQYESAVQIPHATLSEQLFQTAEAHGVDKASHLAFDELRSDFSVKKSSSRFWPQCERIKAAVQLGLLAETDQQEKYSLAADQASEALAMYFKTPVRGLWHDTKDGESFILQPSKASSLYHIINAISEYKLKRPFLKDY